MLITSPLLGFHHWLYDLKIPVISDIELILNRRMYKADILSILTKKISEICLCGFNILVLPTFVVVLRGVGERWKVSI